MDTKEELNTAIIESYTELVMDWSDMRMGAL
jgi:hypothetical protein